jgi:ribonuclease P protein component
VGLPRQHRLKKRRDFQAVYRQGIRRAGKHLILRALELPLTGETSISPTLVGISISQKVSKKAVIRNRIKRQIRAAIRELLPIMANGWHIVIVVKSEATECQYEHFGQELKHLLSRANIIHGH